MNELRYNLTALITVDAEEDGEHTLFHTEDEIMEVLIPDSEEEVNKGLVIKENMN